MFNIDVRLEMLFSLSFVRTLRTQELWLFITLIAPMSIQVCPVAVDSGAGVTDPHGFWKTFKERLISVIIFVRLDVTM